MPSQIGDYTIYRYDEKTPRTDLVWTEAMEAAWPEFMRHDVVADQYYGEVIERLPRYQFTICDGAQVIAAGRSVPVFWDGDPSSLPDSGWDWAIEHGATLGQSSDTANTLSALEMVIDHAHRGQGLSSEGIRFMREIAKDQGFKHLIAPVRPSQKAQYPLIPMTDYITWTRDDGLLFDAWLRTHQRLGAVIAKVAPRSMRIEGTVAEWEDWTGLRFPGSGQHIVPGALAPVTFDLEANIGRYLEPNVWMIHTIA